MNNLQISCGYFSLVLSKRYGCFSLISSKRDGYHSSTSPYYLKQQQYFDYFSIESGQSIIAF
ncbi:MAG: hypothetical protein OCD02_19615 [Spirochaetaceae bacterium]